MPADAATIRATVDAYCAAFTNGDRDAYVGLFADDAWIEDPVGTPKHEGRDAIGAFFDQIDHAGRLDRAAPHRSGARGGGGVRLPDGDPADHGRRHVLRAVIDVMTFDDAGKITTMRAFWDATEMPPAED